MILLSNEIVSKRVEEFNCKLSGGYKGTHDYFELECFCGKKWITKYDIFFAPNSLHRCPECSFKYRSGLQRLDFVDVYNDFKNFGYNLLEKEYVNTRTKMSVEDEFGYKYFITYSALSSAKENGWRFAIFGYGNPYSIENFKLWIVINKKVFTLIDGYYNSSKDHYILLECNNCKKRWSPLLQNIISKECGCPICNRSKGENRISEILNKYEIEYQIQFKFKDCRHIRPLPFDFAIFYDKENLRFLLEYDGETHYFPYRNTENGRNILQKTKINDKIKNEYCKSKNIYLLRISYLDYKNIETILEKELFPSDKEEIWSE